MDRLTVSDLFFNSKEIDNCKHVTDFVSVWESAKDFLANYPAIGAELTAEELAKDFLRRV